MIYGITYSDENMTKAAELCESSMLRHGVDDVLYYNCVDYNFGQDNAGILNAERGCGYWLWKPYIINKRMQHLNDGDTLIYADAGVEFIAPVSHIIDRMDEDIFFFTNGFPHVEWCKGDVLSIAGIKVPTDGQYQHLASFKQVQASVIFFRVNEKTRRFVKEWLLYCQMPGFIDDSPSKLPNYPTFAEHRHDQAILTCLQIKYGYKLHWWPTAYAEHIRVPGDDYPALYNHHRRRNHEF